MTLLDEIISASTSGAVSSADLLRKVRIAAYRLGAEEIARWAKQELDGYGADDQLPGYRIQVSGVTGIFTGPFRSQITHTLSVTPAGMEKWFTVELREPLMELQSLSELKQDPSREWPAPVVARYEASGVFRMDMHGLFAARNVITRQSLKGIIDTVKTRAMDFALELQSDFPEAGSVDGPTVKSEPALAQTINNITNNITGHGSNVAIASTDVRQRSVVKQGDTVALKREVEALGLSASDADAFIDAVSSDRSIEGGKVTTFLERVRSGAIGLAASVSSDLVAESLIELAKSYLGLS